MSLPVLAVAAEVGTRMAAMCRGSPQPQMPRARTSWDLRDLQPRSWIAESPLARSYSNFPTDAGPSSAPLCKRHWRYEVEKGRVPRKKDGEQEKSPQISSKAEKNEAKQRKKNSPGLPALWKEDFPYQIAMNSLNDSPCGETVERLGKKPKYMGDAGIFSQPGPPSDLDDLCCDEGELLGSLVRQPDGSYIWVSENGRQS